MARNPSIIRTSKGVLVDGQFHELPKTPADDGYQRTGSDIARRGGRPKNFGEAPIAHGMKRQTQGALHPYLHGQAVNDEAPNKLNGKTLPVHENMRRTRGCDSDAGSRQLRAAGDLGRSGHNHVGHVKFGALPSSRDR